ncbi:hypothetical protein GGTG_07266 [Gaeumannomyces tritici R3-111a-1]|uniref:C2H2-type domain-containing protein n=1 Tax=Gaeumannomyces tritici (strain R3-111a-1) TaxID=644352 RepID=J3P169_GAET3|nr:hypothetical protein GGTG_07266 [Gaeumannomyces tritici R3-111a-1]EJT77354.1 hypothetical protein GGTG_07266 [Gaeumannomyces tritici R3-111a-1]
MRFSLHHILLAAAAAQLPLASAQDAQGDHQALHVARSEALVRARDAIAEAKVYNDQILARSAGDDALLLVARGSKPSKPSPPSPGPVKPADPPKIPKLRKCVQCGQMCALGEQFHVHQRGFRFFCQDLPGQQTK